MTNTELKFKVGDKVKVRKGCSVESCVGKEGRITVVNKLNEYPYLLDITSLWLFKDSDLEGLDNFPRPIEYDEIRSGDTITVAKNSYGIETVSTLKVEDKSNGYTIRTAIGGAVDAYRATIVLLEREEDPIGTVYSYHSVKGTFIEYYIMTARGLIKAKNVSDPDAKIETIPLSKLTKLPTEQ